MDLEAEVKDANLIIKSKIRKNQCLVLANLELIIMFQRSQSSDLRLSDLYFCNTFIF